MQTSIIANQPHRKIHIDAKRFPLRIEGHRGAGYLEPENSLKAFKRAIDLNLDGVEFDVWLTKDDVPVVLHGYPGGIAEFANHAPEVIGHLHSKDITNYKLKNGETVITLETVFETCKDKMCLNIEVKEVREEVIGKILDLAEEKNMLDQITISSFNHYMRKKLTEEVRRRNLSTKVTFGFLMRIVDPTLPEIGVETQEGDTLNLDIRYLERNREECLEQIRKAKEAKVKIVFWFPMEYTHEESFYDELFRIGTDTIIANKPIQLNEYFAIKQMGL